MHITPFSLPLSRDQFVSALHKGQGRALMHVRQEKGEGLDEAIIDACLHDRAYDPQCEGDRTPWLMEVLDATGAASRLVQHLIPFLDQQAEKYWDALQRSRLALHFALRGEVEARTQLYACFRKWPDSADVIGAREIITLDGAEGLVHVAKYLGTLLQENATTWADPDPGRHYDRIHGEGSARRTLDAAAEQSPEVASYLASIERQELERAEGSGAPGLSVWYLNFESVDLKAARPSSHEEKMKSLKAADVIRQIEIDEPEENRFWYMGWSGFASEEDLATVFQAMVSQTNSGRLRKYLRIFSRRALPEFDNRLLQFANHGDARVRQAGLRALSNCAHPEVRRFAVECLTKGRALDNELKLLNRNYQEGDAPMVERALQIPPDRDRLHGMVFDLVDVCKRNQHRELLNVLLFVYEESPCSNCRHEAVKLLCAMGIAPDWILEECRHDSSEQTRSVAIGRQAST